MLTEQLRGVYKRYKKDTSVFVSWLSTNAKGCGYEAKLALCSNTTGNKGNHGSQFSLKELRNMAQAIVESGNPALQIPRSIAAIARQSVSLRRIFSAQVNQSEMVEPDKASDARHRHFADVLEQVLNKLTDGYVTFQTQETPSVYTNQESYRASLFSPPTLPEKEPSQSDAILLSKSFEALEIQETDDKDVTIPVIDLIADDEDDEIEETVAILDDSEQQLDNFVFVDGFFKELHDLESYICRIWQEYQDNTIDLSISTVLTNAALCLVQNREEELTRELGIPEGSFFERLAQFVPSSVRNSLRSATCEKTALSDFVYRDVSISMKKLWDAIEVNGGVIGREDDGILTNVPTFRRQCEDWGSMSDKVYQSQQERDDELLTQIMIDVIYLGNAPLWLENHAASPLAGNSNMHPIYQRSTISDLLTTALIDSFSKGGSMTAVFAGSLLLRVNAQLGHHRSKAFDELSQYETGITAKFGTANPSKPRGDEKIWKPFDFGHLRRVTLIADCFHDPYVPRLKSKLAVSIAEDPDNEEGEWICPSPDPNFLFQHNPVLCGTRLLNLRLAAESSGVRIANNHLSVMLVANAINALRQSHYLEVEWPLLDQAIDVQLANIFVGQLPKTPLQAHKVFMLRFGQSLAQYSNLSRKPFEGSIIRLPGEEYTTRVRPDCLRTTKVSSILETVFDGEGSWQQAVHALNAEIEKGEKGKKRNRNRSRRVDGAIVPFLTALRPMLEDNLPASSLDYIRLVTDCNELLQHLVNSKVVASAGFTTSFKPPRSKKNKSGKIKSEVMLSVADYFRVAHDLLCQMRDMQEYQEQGRGTVKELDELCRRVSAEIRGWAEKNLQAGKG